MNEIDFSGLAAQTWMAHSHRWEAGQTLRHVPALHKNPLLQYHLWLVREGTVEVRAEEQLWLIESGQAFFLPVSLPREITTPQPAAWLSIGLRITLFNRFNLLENLQLPVLWKPGKEEFARLNGWMEHIVREYSPHAQAHQRLTVLGLSSALLGVCWPRLSSQPLDSASHPELPAWLLKVLRRIAQEPACNISELAREAGFSPAQFRRAFHKWMGVAPRDYLRNRRLGTARHLLETTEASLKTVAVHIGLRDAAHFSQVFKAAYGVSPTHYRASLRGNPE